MLGKKSRAGCEGCLVRGAAGIRFVKKLSSLSKEFKEPS